MVEMDWLVKNFYILILFNLFPIPGFTQPIPMQGFPRTVAATINCANPDSSPIVADFNGDGYKEILISIGSYSDNVEVFLIDHEGNTLPGWPKSFPSNTRIHTAVGDVNNDGMLEAVIKTEKILTVFDFYGNELEGFPVNFSGQSWRSVKLALYDIDNDGDLEIITNKDNTIGVFEHNGVIRTGWPVTVIPNVSNYPVYITNFSVGDLNGDGFAEILFPAEYFNSTKHQYDSARIEGYDMNGNILSGFPIKTDSNYFYESNTACIIYKDKTKDSTFFVINSNYSPSLIANDYTTRVSTYNYNAHLIYRYYIFPNIETFGMLMADFSDDNSLDHVIGNWFDTVRIFTQEGNLLYPNPIISTYNFNSLPSIGKLSSNFNLVAGQSYSDTLGGPNNYAGFIKAFHPNGEELSWSPLRPSGFPTGGILFDDINNDGQTDMVFLTNIIYSSNNVTGSKLYAYTFPGIKLSHENFPWPMYGHDRYRTFNYDFFPDDEHVGIQNINNEIPESFDLLQNYPNPFNNSTIIQFKIAKNSKAELNIYNLLGEKISNLVNQNLSAGTYQVTYTPENLSSGVYFFRLAADGNVFTRKMLMVK
ncbi:MAG TPA: FG-GAP-like repeat-containing protein [Ignavibacteria bacterium]|nr:FG-GAP-like repeat-containing protein [Ignavibacteria bacterium]